MNIIEYPEREEVVSLLECTKETHLAIVQVAELNKEALRVISPNRTVAQQQKIPRASVNKLKLMWGVAHTKKDKLNVLKSENVRGDINPYANWKTKLMLEVCPDEVPAEAKTGYMTSIQKVGSVTRQINGNMFDIRTMAEHSQEIYSG